MKAKRKVAIFDIDGTIFRSSLIIEVVEGLMESGIFDESLRREYEKQKALWLDRKGDYEEYIDALVRVFVRNIKGVYYPDFLKVVERVVLENKDRVYRFTRDMARSLKKKGYYLVAISQSPKAVIDPFCKRLGFNKIYGRLYELGPSEKFTGKIIDEHIIANKANIVRRVVGKENLTLENSYGVGDTDGDYSFLELVENPICFNPNEKLLRHAKRNKWRVVVERKDVIYEIKV